MSAALQHPQRHAVTAAEFLRMGEAGVFAPEARLELIEGEIIEMAPIGNRHASVVARLHELFVRQAEGRTLVWGQSSLILGERSMPQPDVAILKPRADRYFTSHPTAADVLLMVEVSETSLAFDLGPKAQLYARSGVVELWVVDVNERIVRVHRDPSAGGYRTSRIASAEDRIVSVALSGIQVVVRELFPG